MEDLGGYQERQNRRKVMTDMTQKYGLAMLGGLLMIAFIAAMFL